MARVVVISAFAPSLANFRGDLIREIVARGHDVLAVAPEPECRDVVEALGCSYQTFALDRAGANPLRDLRAVAQLAGVLQRQRPDVMFTYGIKPVLYGAIAHQLARQPGRAVALINGLGYVFNDVETRRARRAALRGVSQVYRWSLRRYDHILFQNPDDEAEFRLRRFVPSTAAVSRVAGSGVNTERFPPSPLPPGRVRFLFVGRLLVDKGIRELVEAAGQLRRTHDFECGILGPVDTNPHAVSAQELQRWEAAGAVRYLGETDDVRPFVSAATCVVLPSYREGTPRSILEAMSMGRPVITTDAPGCRETVIHGETGYLVPPRSASALQAAMRRMIEHPERLVSMGHAGRRLAVEKFDVRIVNAGMVRAMGL